jgi:hypothetical protein
MLPLNAIDAIAPAFTRTHETLFSPFQMGRSWKLAASQYLAALGAMFFPFPLLMVFVPKSAWEQMAAIAPWVVGGVVALSLLMLVGIYLCGRMELVDFEMLVTRAQFVAPMWRRYAQRVWPWLGWKIGIGTAATVVIGLALLVPVRHMIMAIAAVMPQGQKVDPAQAQAMIASFWGIYGLFYLMMFLLKIPSTVIADFVMPFFVLEDISFVAAVGRGWEVFVADPIQVLLYLVCKPVLFVVGFICQYVAVFVCAFVIEIVAGIVGAVAYFVFWRNGGAAIHVLLVAGAVVLGLCVFAAIFYLSFGTMGYLMALLNAYAIYFLGGRYPLLGSMLEPGPGHPFTPPPVFPSAEERKDDDDGPPMPMNPAVA